jgi:hypothetical protein
MCKDRSHDHSATVFELRLLLTQCFIFSNCLVWHDEFHFINRWAGHVAWMGKKSNAYSLIVRKPEGKRLLGRPRSKWVRNSKWILEWPALWSSGQSSWIQIQRSRVWFPALLDFLRSSWSGTGFTQPREDNGGATWKESSGFSLENRD